MYLIFSMSLLSCKAHQTDLYQYNLHANLLAWGAAFAFGRTFGEQVDAFEDREFGFTGLPLWLVRGGPVWLWS